MSEPKRLYFVRTFQPFQGGGPTPPLGLLYLASALAKQAKSAVRIRIADTGLQSHEKIALDMQQFAPAWIGLSGMSCEAQLIHQFARTAKQAAPDAKVIVGGPHATIAWEQLLADEHIDFAALGEAECTLTELIATHEVDPASIDGIAFRQNGIPVSTAHRAPCERLDDLAFPAWRHIDMRAYAAYPNWNGSLKEKFYATIMTSRGCPYQCNFCHNMFGKQVRLRSPENVIEEILQVHRDFGVREFHVIDDIFNFDQERAKRICELVIDTGINFALSFPNGLRADRISSELIDLLKKAGTYKINYGFETTSTQLQKEIGKNLDIEQAKETIRLTSDAGIITGAYFMFGFPTQTKEEALETIDYAAHSPLDVAYFFKATPYPGSRFFNAVVRNAEANFSAHYSDYHFYSVDRSYGNISQNELNRLILLAQQRFYFRFVRLWRGFRKATRKGIFVKNLLSIFALIVQSHLFNSLLSAKEGGTK